VAAFTIYDLRRWVRRILLWGVVSAISVTVLAYGVDFVVFRIRLAKAGNAYGSVVVSHYYAVAQKNGKTQFIFDPPAPETCVNALFPHAGAQPCWYLQRHLQQRTDI
jgi:hypothetical protein